jgi:hypothetical protein
MSGTGKMLARLAIYEYYHKKQSKKLEQREMESMSKDLEPSSYPEKFSRNNLNVLPK